VNIGLFASPVGIGYYIVSSIGAVLHGSAEAYISPVLG
jgi:hypothetical protein